MGMDLKSLFKIIEITRTAVDEKITRLFRKLENEAK